MYIYIYIYIYMYILYMYVYIYMHIYIYIHTNSTITIFFHCFINIDACAKAMEPATTASTLHPITTLGTRTIFLAYLKNISKNYL